MDRRGFLKGTGFASVAGVAAVAVSQANRPALRWVRLREVAVGDRMYRVDGSSQVYVSEDGGDTWTVHTAFNKRYSVQGIGARAGGVRIRVAFAGGHRFTLALGDDQQAWLTA